MPKPDDRAANEKAVADARARNRFLAINFIRIGGIAMILFSIVILNGMVQLPDAVGYLLLALGLFETFVMPQMLARVWSTNDRSPPGQ